MVSRSGHVELTVEDSVGIIRLVNPPLNQLTDDMRSQLRAVAEQVAGRNDIRAVVLTSSGDRSLSVGSDISGFPTTVEGGRRVSESEHAAYDAMEAIAQPVVAVLRGHTLGGGLELSLTADIRVAEANTIIGLPEVTIGVFASGGGTQRLPQLIGAARAKHLLLLGESIDADTALAWGLVTTVVAHHAGETEALRLAARLAALPALAVRATKHCVDVGLRQGRSAGRAAEIASIADIYSSADAREGACAFLEKRPPRFTHQPTQKGLSPR